MKNRSDTFSDWLGIKTNLDFTKARWLGGLISVLGLCLAALILFLVLYRFIAALSGFGDFESAEAQSAAIRNTGLALAALIGVPFLVWRSFVAQKQVNIAEQGQITDRINQAVQGLGAEKTTKTVHSTPRGQTDLSKTLTSPYAPILDYTSVEQTEPNLEIRLGAIYALERIAQDSSRDHIQIMEILTAYIRGNAPIRSNDPGTGNEIRPDIQAALSVIGRRTEKQKYIEQSTEQHTDDAGFRLDLSFSCLNHAKIGGLNFDNVRFMGSHFKKAYLQGTSLRHCNLNQCEFNQANLDRANFSGSMVWSTDLTEAKFDDLSLGGASLRSTKISFEMLVEGASTREFFMDETVVDASIPLSAFLSTGSETEENAQRREEQFQSELGLPKFHDDSDAYDAWIIWRSQTGLGFGNVPKLEG